MRKQDREESAHLLDMNSRSTQSMTIDENTFKNGIEVINLSSIMESPISANFLGEIVQDAVRRDTAKKETMDQKHYDETFGFRRVNLSMGERVKWHFKQINKWKKTEWLNFISCRVPFSKWIVRYPWKDVWIDILGGMMISVMSVPQSLAYGYLVGVPPKYGLITGIVGPLIYAFMGSSKHASPGAFAIVALMTGAAVQNVALGPAPVASPNETVNHICCQQNKQPLDESMAIGTAATLTLLVGLFQIMFGLLNAGLLAVWLSDQLIQGLTSGAAIHVMTSQIKTMTGIRKVPPTGEPLMLIQFYVCFFSQIEKLHVKTTVCSLICITLLLVSAYGLDPYIKKVAPVKFPMELMLVLISTILTWQLDGSKYALDLEIVGFVEPGMPSPMLPPMNSVGDLFVDSITIGIISFVIHIALAKLIAKKMDYEVDANQEWFALGLMHTVSSFFGCFPGGSSLGRTMMQMKCGTKSQLSTIVCCMVLIIFVFGAITYIQYLPKAVLAAIVVVSLKDLFIQLYDAFRLCRKSTFDYVIFIITFTSTLLLNVKYGLIIGVGFALLTVVFRTQWADSMCLGRIPGTSHFRGMGHYNSAVEIPGIKIFRFDAPLYFANAELFSNRVYRACGLNPVAVRQRLQEQEAKKQKKQENATPVTPFDNQVEVRGRKVRSVNPDNDADKTTQDGSKHEVEEANAKPKDTVEITRLTHIILDCSSIVYADLMGKDALMQTFKDYQSIDIPVLFANIKEMVRQLLDKTEFYEKVPENRIYSSLSDAVNQAICEQRNVYKNELSPKKLLRKEPEPVAKSVALKTLPLELPPTQMRRIKWFAEAKNRLMTILQPFISKKQKMKLGELDKTQNLGN